jgi:hypothetical protein
MRRSALGELPGSTLADEVSRTAATFLVCRPLPSTSFRGKMHLLTRHRLWEACKPPKIESNNKQRRNAVLKPKVFLGSSVEGLAFAQGIANGLDYAAQAVPWSLTFPASGTTIDSLLETFVKYDFAVFVFSRMT